MRLFALSFTSLFLELMVIRWVPSEVRLVAYYANLMLVSSFLGLGIGAMVSSRGWKLFRFFAPLLMLSIVLLLLIKYISELPTAAGEWRFQDGGQKGFAYLSLVCIFIFNAISFVPLGEEIGQQFHRLPALRAYTWDLGGSLTGTIFFGIFSLLHFSPILGMTLVVLVVLWLSTWKQRVWGVPFYAITLALVIFGGNQQAHWSPYYFITVNENYAQQIKLPNGELAIQSLDRPAGEPPADVRTMQNPPIYTVKVNQDFYQMHGTVDMSRYSPNSWQAAILNPIVPQYSLPYQFLGKRADRVLVLGAGGGMDVQAGLLNGAARVDAVEIDPVIPKISNKYSAAAPYTDTSRVFLHIDDARAFLQNSTDSFDMVVFGFLDSQALFSYGASLRLDGYTYTIESFRKGFELVRDGGVMSVSFFAGTNWMAEKLEQMVEAATNTKPLVYYIGARIIIIAKKGTLTSAPAEYFGWKIGTLPGVKQDLASDDWPYLYVEHRSIPHDYAVVIGILLVVSIIAVAGLRGTSFGTSDGHFLFMGWGFLLLQTKSIGDCSLFFGTTWFVTTIVITGVLLMVLLANWVAIRFLKSFSPWFYAPLFASLALLLFVPREYILGYSYGVRMIWTLIAVPLPIFFAGLIFSTTFREGGNPSALFGSNLMGATIGGFCEYMSMWIGSQALSYIVIAAYIASLTCILLSRKKGTALSAPAAA